MACYYSNFGESYQIPFDYSFRVVPSDFDSAYDERIANDHRQYLHHYPMNYYYYSPNVDQTSFASSAYSAFTLSEAKHVVYDPNCYYNIYERPPDDAISQTRISNSVLEFNEPDFEEYDPTPYGGGYDICTTYGKPLPPSVKTCYPLSSVDPTNSQSLDNVPVVPVVEPSIEKDKVQDQGFIPRPTNETKQTQAVEEMKQLKQEEEDEEGEDADEEEEEEEEEDDDDDEEGTDEGAEHRGGCGSDKIGNGDAVQVKAQYIPSGYGLEAMDLCETIFGGYFPCLLRNKRRNDQCFAEVSSYERNDYDPWMRTSDYLFGNLNPYIDEGSNGRSNTDCLYGYQRHYQ